MYIFITHFFTEYVIFKYLLQYNLLNKLYSAIFRSSGHLASFLHPSLDIYPAFFYHTALSLIHYAGASCDRQTQRHHH